MERRRLVYSFWHERRKKLSDYFSDHKFSRLDKERTWLLCSGGAVIWIVGERSDDRFCLDKTTKSVLVVNFFRQKARVSKNIITFAKIYSADVLLMIQISSTIRFSHEIINYQIIKDTMIALYACVSGRVSTSFFIIHFALCKNITF